MSEFEEMADTLGQSLSKIQDCCAELFTVVSNIQMRIKEIRDEEASQNQVGGRESREPEIRNEEASDNQTQGREPKEPQDAG